MRFHVGVGHGRKTGEDDGLPPLHPSARCTERRAEESSEKTRVRDRDERDSFHQIAGDEFVRRQRGDKRGRSDVVRGKALRANGERVRGMPRLCEREDQNDST